MGEMKRANAREIEERQRDCFASTLVIVASIICAVRLANRYVWSAAVLQAKNEAGGKGLRECIRPLLE
jgi:hypothetical protein